MKLLHLGDLHIGKSLGDFDLLDDQRFILDWVLETAETKEVDAVLLSGDIYDRPVPSEGAVRLLDYFLCELAKRSIKVFMISGNHDSDERLNFGSTFFANQGIYIAAKYNGELFHKQLTDEYGIVNFYLLPFVKASQVRHFHPEAEISSYDEAVGVVIKRAEIDKSERNVILSHQFVAGITGQEIKPELGGSESVSVQTVGLVEQVGLQNFYDFDYVALGHIHRPQKLGRDTVRYAGSPLKYSLTECHDMKSVPLITLKEKGDISVELLPVKPKRDLRHIKGKLSQLLAKENLQDTDDYIYATLTDDEPQDNAMGIIQSYYPNTVKLDYHNAHTISLDDESRYEAVEIRSFEDLIGDFYKMVYGENISEEELKIMQEIGGKAGVTHEAD